MMKRLRLFAGNSHPELAQALAAELGIELGKMDIKRFSNGEIYVQPLESVRGCDVFVLQTASSNVDQDMMELFVILDALKRSFATNVHVIMPHYAYARQDRVAAPREPISARLMADLISTAGATHLITFSLHSGQTQGFFNFPVDNIHTHLMFARYFKSKGFDPENIVIVSPDAGGGKAAKRLADPLGCQIAIMNKSRPAHNEAEVTAVVGDVEGKTCIIFDDMIDTGGSVSAAHKALIASGAHPDIYLAATHPLFSGPCVERLNAAKFKEVVITDTLPLEGDKASVHGLKVISVAPVLSKIIQSIHAGQSVTSVWDS